MGEEGGGEKRESLEEGECPENRSEQSKYRIGEKDDQDARRPNKSKREKGGGNLFGSMDLTGEGMAGVKGGGRKQTH